MFAYGPINFSCSVCRVFELIVILVFVHNRLWSISKEEFNLNDGIIKYCLNMQFENSSVGSLHLKST